MVHFIEHYEEKQTLSQLGVALRRKKVVEEDNG